MVIIFGYLLIGVMVLIVELICDIIHGNTDTFRNVRELNNETFNLDLSNCTVYNMLIVASLALTMVL